MAGSKLGNAFRQRLAERKKPDAKPTSELNSEVKKGVASGKPSDHSRANAHTTKKPEVEPTSLHPIDQSAAFFADEIAADIARDRQKRWKAARKKSRKHWAWRHR